MAIRVTVWNEFRHEVQSESIKEIYPDGIHQTIAKFLNAETDIEAGTATLDEENHGITPELLKNTDVMIWWGHMAHHEVKDEIAEMVAAEVRKGMGLIVLHSGHLCKPFTKLMGTSCTLLWRDDDRERLWCVSPNHPIAKDVPLQFELENEEMYGEFFDIPEPDELVYLGWFKGGEVFRSGCCYNRGYGKVFYFQPGHEEYPIYHNENIQKIITNAVRWAKGNVRLDELTCPNPPALEK